MTESADEAEGDGGPTEDPDTSPGQILSWASVQKEKASDSYHQEESGSFEQGLKLGRRHAMSDLIEFIQSQESAGDSSAE